MRRAFSAGAAAALLCGATAAPLRAETTKVDVELCLAADGSGSIAEDEFRFQRAGYAAAIADPQVLDAIRSGLHGRIALALMEWGGADSMNEIVGWMLVAHEESAAQFGARLVADPRIGATGYTGSRAAGLALKAAADAAGKPIYLELSSVNPVVILPGAIDERCDKIVDEYATSCLITLAPLAYVMPSKFTSTACTSGISQ